ncbi:GvpL/GvpF family gas vesicle protein [Nocardioides ginsengisoli]|uniref:GvpL/GvpF family gas vesicle protein n=1 Tax=Nocardioides ginsengisoli TaxID=363868 RepID=A0ABW3W461_9ACTN
MSEPETGRYLYAVCRGLDPAVVREVTALYAAPLELVAHQDLAAVVSTVPMAVFGEEALRRNLEDMTWLEDVVRLHDDVVRAVAVRAPTAPMRLATVCFDDAAVRARLRAMYIDLSHVLDRVEGCSEWSVKVLAPPDELAEAQVAAAAPSSGADYLRRKQTEARRRATRDDSAADAAARIHDELARLSRASRRLPPQDPRLSGLRGTMVLNAAFLVPDADRASFATLLDQLRADGGEVVVDARGPWPPYSFAMLDAR